MILVYLAIPLLVLFFISVYIFTIVLCYNEIENGNFHSLIILIPLIIIMTMIINNMFNFNIT